MKFTPLSVLAILVLFITAPGCDDPNDTPVAKILFTESFETSVPFAKVYNMEVGTWNYAVSYPDGFAYSGQKAARFEIRESQEDVAGGKRSEVAIIRGADGKLSRDAWYSFAVAFPENGFEYDHEHDVITQWVEDGSPVRLLAQKDSLFLEIGANKGEKKEYFIEEISKNNWHEVIIHIYHSHGDDGLLEFWYDGDKKVSHTGGNLYTDVLPKWKIGIYKPAYSEGTADVPTRIIYYDNIKVGDENCSIDDMSPKHE